MLEMKVIKEMGTNEIPQIFQSSECVVIYRKYSINGIFHSINLIFLLRFFFLKGFLQLLFNDLFFVNVECFTISDLIFISVHINVLNERY